MTVLAGGVRHLYVHLPFCAHRCGYCDFVTLVGRPEQHARYVDAILGELELERGVLSEPLDTIFLGGGTPTFTEPVALRRLLEALPGASEATIEANPETVTPELAKLLAGSGITRVSLGVQTFKPELLDVLERRAKPDDVRRAIYHLRDAKIDNISLDLIYGIPGQEPSDLERDLDEALALEPEHLSCYELEAKPGTRFRHAYGDELARQSEAMEDYFERVVERLVAAGYRWYETANFCRPGRQSRHNLGYWLGRDYLGLGIGAVSTVEGLRWRNAPNLGGYLRAIEDARAPARELEPIDGDMRRRERLMLGLRLDEPVPVADVAGAVKEEALERLERLGLAERRPGGLILTRRGRFLGGAVTVELLEESLEITTL
ncbi:MAG TPA: radical SAM family heme chaperone HemW [Gaiellaceae bacterium]|nr:radical SAM family heme chaperone HemW [Gaiellaceae bacterium]